MSRNQRVGLLVGTLAAAAGAFHLLWLAVQTVRPRLAYGFDLEWMEGGMLVHALRLREGLGLYVEPGPDFIPYIYPPLYPWILSLLGEPSYAVGRTVSALATVGAMAALGALLRLDKTPWLFVLGAMAAYLSCYDESGSFYDLIRGDALALCLAGWSLVAIRRATSASVVAGGLLLAAAYLAKHNYALLGLSALVWLWHVRGRELALRFAVASAGSAILVTAVLTYASEGRFLVYLLGVPAVHPIVGARVFPGAEMEIVSALPILVVAGSISILVLLWRTGKRDGGLWLGAVLLEALVAVAVFLDVRPAHLPVVAIVLGAVAAGVAATALVRIASKSGWEEGALFWVLNTLVLGMLCAVMRGHHGGFINVLMPGYWVLAGSMAWAMGRVWLAMPHPGLAVLAGLIFAGQSWQGGWDVKRYQPTAEDTEAGQRLLDTISSYEGDVLMPHAPWYPVMVGKAPTFPLISLWDVAHKGGPFFGKTKTIDRAFAEKRWDAVILPKGKKEKKGLGHGMAKSYERVPTKDVSMPGRVFWTRAGWRVRPYRVWEPVSENESP